MSRRFLYFGFNECKQLEAVKLITNDETVIENGVCFDTLDAETSHYTISDIFLGWSYLLFDVDGKILHCGLKNGICSSKPMAFFTPADRDKILKIDCGWKQSLLITKQSLCYLAEENSSSLTRLDCAGLKIKDGAIGDRHCVLISEEGEMLTVKIMSNSAALLPIKLKCPISTVACGKEHVLLLAHGGRLFSFGIGSRGQLGHGDTDPQEKPTLVEALDGVPIKTIAVGGWHSAAVSVTGDLYMWGWNESGQLGLPCSHLSQDDSLTAEIVTIQSIPRAVEFKTEVTVESVSCGSRHSAVLTENHDIWSWGWNRYGQLGIQAKEMVDSPELVPLPCGFQPHKVTCAYWSTLINGFYYQTRDEN